MTASANDTAMNVPGKLSFWGNSRFTHTVGGPDSEPASTRPGPIGINTLDNLRSVFWQAYKHLFPPHALAAQTGNGNLVISWSVADDPHAVHPYAAPVLLRFEKDLVDRMQQAAVRDRIRMALDQEPTLREGLRGYDPFARLPNARVINVG